MRKEQQRDQGLARLGRGTRWLTAGALASAGCLSIAVAETLPGRSSAAPRPPTPATTPTSAPTATTPPPTARPGNDGDTDTDDGGATAPTAPAATAPPQTLAPPTMPPTTAYNPPVVSSGGS